jgi:tetratricopeptide (TPR) repeat protein
MLALLMAAFLAAGSASALESARDRQDRAALQKFIEEYAGAAAKAPNDAAAQRRLALACSYLAEVAMEQRDRNQARQAANQGIGAAEKAVSLNASADNYRLLGILYGQGITDLMSGLKYGPRARDAINKALEKAPNSAPLYVARGVGTYYLPPQLGGGSKAAIADFRKAIELDPRNAEAYLWLGISLNKENMPAEARQALTKSLDLSPNRLWAKQQLEKIPAQ